MRCRAANSAWIININYGHISETIIVSELFLIQRSHTDHLNGKNLIVDAVNITSICFIYLAYFMITDFLQAFPVLPVNPAPFLYAFSFIALL